MDIYILFVLVFSLFISGLLLYYCSVSPVSSKSSDFRPILIFGLSLFPVTINGIPIIPKGGNPNLILRFNLPSRLVVPSMRGLNPANLNLNLSMVIMLFFIGILVYYLAVACIVIWRLDCA